MASSARSISARGGAGRQRCCTRSIPATRCVSRCGRKISAIGRPDGGNVFPGRVIDRRYQGTQTVYDIDLFGARLEALELGTAARHQIGVETSVALPREGLWAYRDTGPSSYD